MQQHEDMMFAYWQRLWAQAVPRLVGVFVTCCEFGLLFLQELGHGERYINSTLFSPQERVGFVHQVSAELVETPWRLANWNALNGLFLRS